MEIIEGIKKVRAVLNILNEREQKIIKLRFGLEDGTMHTLEEVGKVFGVTRERIRQIEAKALYKMNREFSTKTAIDNNLTQDIVKIIKGRER